MESIGNRRTETKEKPKTFSEIRAEATDKLEKLRNSVAFGEVRGGTNEEYLAKYDTDKYKGQIQWPIAKLIKALEEAEQFGDNAKISETQAVESKIKSALHSIEIIEKESVGIILGSEEKIKKQKESARREAGQEETRRAIGEVRAIFGDRKDRRAA